MLSKSIRSILIIIIKFYQYFISPWLGNNCRFWPSCSEYTKEAIITHGVIKGIWFGAIRLLKCQPLCDGGYDPVPPAKRNNT